MWGHAGSRNSKLSFECRCILKLPKSPSGKLKVMFYIVLFSLGAHQSFDDICLFVCWILYCKIANWTVVTLVPESFWNDPWSWMDSTVFSFFFSLPVLTGMDLRMWKRIWTSYSWISWTPKIIVQQQKPFPCLPWLSILGIWYNVWNFGGLDLHRGWCTVRHSMAMLATESGSGLLFLLLGGLKCRVLPISPQVFAGSDLGRFPMIYCQVLTGPNS